jgi:formylglycine-generating enzyme required for sulfatase activity
MRAFNRVLFHAAWPLLVALTAPALAGEGTWTEPVSGIEFARLPAGCFMMGEPAPGIPKEADVAPLQRADEQPRHSACVAEFWIARTELAWQQWQRVSALPLPPRARPAQAAFGLSWADANDWLRDLTAKAGAPGTRFRLPTEAEWEYACRAGNSEPVFSGDVEGLRKLHRELTRVAWYKVPDFPDRWAHEVGRKQANAWGLHDMLGNVMEWVEDQYRADAYVWKMAKAAMPGDTTRLRVVRGGSYKSYEGAARCGARASLEEDDRLPTAGMRVVMERRETK